MSSPAVAMALALAETRAVSGRDLILAVALANEIACRVGSVVPGQFHRRGFHPTGLFAPFGIAIGAGRLLGLTSEQMTWAAGIVGSLAAGLLECWVDGTQTKFLHSGFAAQNGIHAAMLAQAGATGPPRVLEGRFGLFASHLQDASLPKAFGRVVDDLGTRWDSRDASFKPFPAAHVLHPYIDLVLRLREQHGIRPGRRAVDRLPGGGVQRVDRVRAGGGEGGAGHRGPRPRVPAVHARRGAGAGAAGPLGVFRRRPQRPRHPGAGAPHHLPRGPGVPAAGPVQGRRARDAEGRACVRRGGGVQPRLRAEPDDARTSCAPSSTTTPAACCPPINGRASWTP